MIYFNYVFYYFIEVKQAWYWTNSIIITTNNFTLSNIAMLKCVYIIVQKYIVNMKLVDKLNSEYCRILLILFFLPWPLLNAEVSWRSGDFIEGC